MLLILCLQKILNLIKSVCIVRLHAEQVMIFIMTWLLWHIITPTLQKFWRKAKLYHKLWLLLMRTMPFLKNQSKFLTITQLVLLIILWRIPSKLLAWAQHLVESKQREIYWELLVTVLFLKFPFFKCQDNWNLKYLVHSHKNR